MMRSSCFIVACCAWTSGGPSASASVARRADTHDDKFQTIVLTEIAALKGALNAEKEERVAEDEQIVHAINDYTRALQDGLRIVNQS